MNIEALGTMITLNLVDKDIHQDHLTVLLIMKQLSEEGVTTDALMQVWNEFINSDRHLTGQPVQRT